MATGRSKSQTKAKRRSTQASEPEGTRPGTLSFFDGLKHRGFEPILKGDSGAIRFDLSGGPRPQRWYVTIAKGDITVSNRSGRADTVVHVDAGLFDRIAQGRANALAAQLRGELLVEGDGHLLMVFQRLFPGPPTATGRPPAGPAHPDRPAR